MEEIIPQINSWVLIALGVFLMAMEIMTMIFILVFFGFAFVLVGMVSFFMGLSGEVQVLTAIILGGLLTLFLRKPILKLMKTEDLPLETLNTGEVGVLEGHDGQLRVNYKGTTWAVSTGLDDTFSAGEKVVVESLENNLAMITKL